MGTHQVPEERTASDQLLDSGPAVPTAPHQPSPESPPTTAVLSAIELALFHLRRVWAKPDIVRRLRKQTPGGHPVQTSSLLVVHAIAQLTNAAECAVAPRTSGAGPSAPHAPADVTVGAVAERLEIDPSTASRLVGHAINAGFVSRHPSPTDARRVNLQLTDAGKGLKEVANRFRRAYLATLLADWTDGERAEFARLLTRFTDSAAQAPMDLGSIDKIFAAAEQEPS